MCIAQQERFPLGVLTRLRRRLDPGHNGGDAITATGGFIRLWLLVQTQKTAMAALEKSVQNVGNRQPLPVEYSQKNS
jgi:hypothetical protein